MNPAIEAVRAQFPPFVEFESIPRLFRDMIITEKLDGTNALVEVREDGQVWAGSRTRYITPEADNYGFAKWVKAHEDELRDGLGVGRHFGEWWGQGIQRGYNMAHKEFSLFNVGRWYNANRSVDAALYIGDRKPCPACCSVVPVLYVGDFCTEEAHRALDLLSEGGSIASVGFLKPEGIVVYHPKSKQLFKATLDKNDGHKGSAS